MRYLMPKLKFHHYGYNYKLAQNYKFQSFSKLSIKSTLSLFFSLHERSIFHYLYKNIAFFFYKKMTSSQKGTH